MKTPYDSPDESISVPLTSPNNWPKLVPRNRGKGARLNNGTSESYNQVTPEQSEKNNWMDFEGQVAAKRWRPLDTAPGLPVVDAKNIKEAESKPQPKSKSDDSDNKADPDSLGTFAMNDEKPPADNEMLEAKESTATKKSRKKKKSTDSLGNNPTHKSEPGSRLSTFFNFKEEVPALDIQQAICDFQAATGMLLDQFWGYPNSESIPEETLLKDGTSKDLKKKAPKKKHNTQGGKKRPKSAGGKNGDSKPDVSPKKEKENEPVVEIQEKSQKKSGKLHLNKV